MGDNTSYVDNADDFLFDPNPEIGGAIVPLIGDPGAGKTNALIQIGMSNIKGGHIVVWKGSKEAQWINFVANDIPVTVWNHDSMEEFDAFVTAKTPEGEPDEVDFSSKTVEFKGKERQAIEVDTWQDAEDLVANFDRERVNVVNIPGLAQLTEYKYPRYFFMKTWKDVLFRMVDRRYLNFITMLGDEWNEVAPPQQQATNPFNKIVSDQMPPIYAQLRKNNVLLYGAGHATHDLHYTFWGVKANARINMRGANIKPKLDPAIDQNTVNSLDRGEFVMSGFEMSDFALLKEGNDLDWIGGEGEDDYRVKFRVDWEADIPDYLGEEKDAENLEEANKAEVILNARRRTAFKLTQEPFNFTQEMIGELYDRDQSTVSEWIRDQRQKRAEDSNDEENS